MSNNYEEAWAELKDIVRNVKKMCSRYEGITKNYMPDFEEFIGAEIASGIILDYMNEIEEKLTTSDEEKE